MVVAESDQTIKQMLAGFSSMQFNLGLLPMQTSQSMAGAPMQMPPPPPPMPHPAQAAAEAMAQHQQMIQQTLMAAQQTRYIPPPSAPMPSIGAMGSSASMGNPFAPQPGNYGGPGASGGWGGGGGRGNGNYAAGPAGPQLPSMFNPFAATLPPAHFASPAQRNLQLMNATQSQFLGTAAGLTEGGLGIGSSLIGGAVGSAFGPLGTMAGSYLGGKLGGGLANMALGPAIQDVARGRNIQAMTAASMVSGPMLNATTGQGMDAFAARQTATGLRRMQHDFDFERTGFNTQDTMRIMQGGTDAGLLKGAQSPEQMVAKVKELAKSVKMLMQATGDPDVRAAIQAMGEMRELGFTGMGRQAGAVASRAMTARMAGVSQSEMHQYGMMGAGMAGQYGMAGATGYTAATHGAAQANIAASSGALNDLQLARGGGKSGVAALNARAQMAVMNDDRHLLSALKKGADGKLSVSSADFSAAMNMSVEETARASADKLRELGPEGITQWHSQRQELKDQAAQGMSATQRRLAALSSARQFQKSMGGKISLATAFSSVTGESAEDGRTLALQNTPAALRAEAQQLRTQMAQAAGQDIAATEVDRTPGLLNRMGRSVRGGLAGAADWASSPFRKMADMSQRDAEADQAAASNQRILRFEPLAIGGSDAEYAGARRLLNDAGFRKGVAGRTGGRDSGALSRMRDFGGLMERSSFMRSADAVAEAQGVPQGMRGMATLMMDAGMVNRVEKSVSEFDRAISASDAFGAKEGAQLTSDLTRATGKDGRDVANKIRDDIFGKIRGAHAGTFLGAKAIGADTFRDAARQRLKEANPGMSAKELDANVEKMLPAIMADAAVHIKAVGSQKDREVLATAQRAAGMSGAAADNVGTAQGRLDEMYTKASLGEGGGLNKVTDETMGKLYKGLDKFRGKDGKVEGENAAVVAAATIASLRKEGSPESIAKAEELEKEIKTKYGDKAEGILQKGVRAAGEFQGNSQTALRRTAKGSKGLAGFEEAIGAVADSRSGYIAAAQVKLARAALGDAGASKDAKTTEEALKVLGEDGIDASEMTTAQKAAAKIALKDPSKTGNFEAMFKPTATTQRAGGNTGKSGKALSAEIAALENAATELEVEKQMNGGTASAEAIAKTDVASTQAFAKAVGDFSEAVKSMNGGGENATLGSLFPLIQAQVGGK